MCYAPRRPSGVGLLKSGSGITGLGSGVKDAIGSRVSGLNPKSRAGGFERFKDQPLAGQLEIPQMRDPERP